MSTVPAISTDVELMDTEAERTLWEVVRTHERPPYFFPDEGVGNRLARAARILTDGRLTPNADGSYTVEGSGKRMYRVTDRCSCPQAQQGKSHWCYHHISVVLYVEWMRRQGFTPQGLPTTTAAIRREVQAAYPDGTPVDDQTLALALPPTTVDERLRQQPPAAPSEPEEPEMTEDPSAYIPEPDTAPVAVAGSWSSTGLERPTPAVAPRVAPTDLELALSTWTAERAIVQRFLTQELKAGVDFYTLKISGRESKPSLSKAGAEKVMGWLKIQASFAPDTGTWEMLGRPTDQVFYVCTLRTRSGEIVGEGRGARSLKKDGGDVNKSIKMAEKSACVSAVLRTGALSDVFTQDFDPEEPEAPPVHPAPTSADLRQQIWAHLKEQAPEVTTREQAGRWVKERTGYPLVESNFRAILHALVAG